MIRARCFVLGVSLALFACGKTFEAEGSSAGGAGMPSSLGGGVNAGAGGAPAAGAEPGGNPGQSAGEAGADPGGSPAELGGSGGAVASAGGASAAGAGGVSAGGVSAGGASAGGASAGGGGVIEVPPIPVLGLALWLRADRGIVQKDGLVQQWLDQSSNQMDAIQTGANVRPTYLATGFNGRPTLDFDGKEDFLKFEDGFSDFTHGLSGFVVAKPLDSACASMLEFSNGSELDDISLGMWQDKWTYEVSDGYIQQGDVDKSAFALYGVVQRATGTLDFRLNGDLSGTMSFATPKNIVRENNFVGHTLYDGCNYFQGQISEIILYARPVTDKELLTIESYLQEHWGLGSAETPTSPAR